MSRTNRLFWDADENLLMPGEKRSEFHRFAEAERRGRFLAQNPEFDLATAFAKLREEEARFAGTGELPAPPPTPAAPQLPVQNPRMEDLYARYYRLRQEGAPQAILDAACVNLGLCDHVFDVLKS